MNWMVNSRRMRAAEGLYKKSPRLHGDARGKERFCPSGRASRRPHPPFATTTTSSLYTQGIVGKQTQFTCPPCGVSDLIAVVSTQMRLLSVTIMRRNLLTRLWTTHWSEVKNSVSVYTDNEWTVFIVNLLLWQFLAHFWFSASLDNRIKPANIECKWF